MHVHEHEHEHEHEYPTSVHDRQLPISMRALTLTLILVGRAAGQPSWSSVVTNSPSAGISVSSIVGGVEDPAHMGINCSCVDRHKARILFVPDLLDSSYAGTLISQGAQRAAIDFGVQLHIAPSKAFSADMMAQWINQATNTNTNSSNTHSNGSSNGNLAFFPSYPGPPDWVISGLPSTSVNVEPLSSLLSMYATLGIPFSSVHSASLPLIQQLAQSDMGHAWHVGADNVYTGRVAAEQLISQMSDWVAQQAPLGAGVNIPLTDLFTPVALCFNDMIGLEAGDDRCQGFAVAWSSLNVSVVVSAVNALTANYHPTLNLINAYTQASNGRALPILAVDEEVMAVVRSAITWGGDTLTNAQPNTNTNSNTNTSTNISIQVPPLWIAAIDVSPTTASALQEANGAGVVRVALDQQPFMQGYLSVALSALAVRTGTFPSQLLYQTGPVVVDRSTPDLMPHAQLEHAGFPECTATNTNTNTNTTASATATPPADVPCFNRSTVKFQSTFHAAAGPAGEWAAPLRAGIYQASVDMRVRVDDLLQTTIDPSVNIAGYAALNEENNLPVSQRSYQGVMMVKRGSDAQALPMIWNLTDHGMPIVTFNNWYFPANFLANQTVLQQPIAHVGSDKLSLIKDVVIRLLAMAKCKHLAMLDPDGSWATDDTFAPILSGLQAAGLNASILFADSSNPAAVTAAITATKSWGTDCFFLGTTDVQLSVMISLGVIGNPLVHIGVFDFDAMVMDLLQRGQLTWALSQGDFYQGYLPPMLLTLLWLTGGPTRGNRLLKTNNITNEDSYYSTLHFPYIESGPQFLTPRTHGLSRLAACAPADAGLVPPTMTLPALVNIRDFPFARMAFPVCLEPPPRYYAVVTTPDTIPRFQPNYDTSCPAGTTSPPPSPSWCSLGPANSTNVPSLSYTLNDSQSYIPTALVVVLLNYAQQLVPAAITSQWRALLNNNDLLVTSTVVSRNSTWSGFDYSTNSSSLLTLGFSSAPLVNSVASFPVFGLSAPPGTSVAIVFGLTLLDGQRIQTNPMILIQPECAPAQYAQSRSVSASRNVLVCTPCAPGYTSQGANATTCEVITTYFPVAGAAVVQGVIGVMMLVFAGVVVCMAANRHHPLMRSFSPVYCCMSLVGVVMVLCGALLMLDTSASTMVGSCTASVYLFNLGFTLAFGAVWVKLLRLFRIFDNPLLHMIAITSQQLVLTLAAMVSVDVVLISVWLGVAPYTLRTGRYQTCVSSLSSVFNGILIGTKGMLVLSAAWLTYKTRSIPSRFNESKAITLAIYNTAIISIVLCGLWMGLEGQVGAVAVSFIKALGIMLGAFVFAGLLFSPMLRVLYRPRMRMRMRMPISHTLAPSTHKHDARADEGADAGTGMGTSTGRSKHKSARGSRDFDGGAGGRAGSVGVDSLVVEHGDVFELGKGDLSTDLEEGLAQLMPSCDELEAVVRQLKRWSAAGGPSSIHPLEQKIITTYRDMMNHRAKCVEHYRRYKRAIMTISLINAQFHEAKRMGTLDQYEATAPTTARTPVATAAPAPPTAASTAHTTRRGTISEGEPPMNKHKHGTATGTGTGTLAHHDGSVDVSSPFPSSLPSQDQRVVRRDSAPDISQACAHARGSVSGSGFGSVAGIGISAPPYFQRRSISITHGDHIKGPNPNPNPSPNPNPNPNTNPNTNPNPNPNPNPEREPAGAGAGGDSGPVDDRLLHGTSSSMPVPSRTDQLPTRQQRINTTPYPRAFTHGSNRNTDTYTETDTDTDTDRDAGMLDLEAARSGSPPPPQPLRQPAYESQSHSHSIAHVSPLALAPAYVQVHIPPSPRPSHSTGLGY